MNKLTVLLDIDNTIFDIDASKVYTNKLLEANYGENSPTDFYKEYESVKRDLGYVDWKEVAMRFAKIRNSEDYASVLAIFLEIPFKRYLRPNATELIDFLSKNTDLVIFSDGDELFQRTKVDKLELSEKAKEVVISKSKVQLLPDMFRNYKGKIVVIDDKPQIIREAKKLLAEVVSIWIKYGRYAKEEKSLGASLETENLSEVKAYIQKLQ